MVDTAQLKPILDLLVTPGDLTSEFKQAQQAGRMSMALVILGVLGVVAGSIAAAYGDHSKIGIVAGSVAAMVGTITAMLTSLGYSKSRADVKTSGQAAAASLASPPVSIALKPPTP